MTSLQTGKIGTAAQAERLIRSGNTVATGGVVGIGFAEAIAIALQVLHCSDDPHKPSDLTLLFAARMNGYLATLEALSHVLAFFHSHPIFSTADYPALDARVGKLIMELYPSTPEVMNQIWTTIGATYQPSLLYRAQARFIDYLAPR